MSAVLRGMLAFIGFGRVRDVGGTARDACVHQLWQGARCQWYCAGCLRSSALAGCEMSAVLRGMLAFISFGRVRDVGGTTRDACVHRLWQGARCRRYCAGCLRSSALAGCEMSAVLRGMLAFIGFGRVRDVSGTARDACVHQLWQGARCRRYYAGCLRSSALAGCEMSAVLRGILASSAFVGCVSLSAGRGMLEFIGFGRVRDVSATTWDACVHRLLWGVRGEQPDVGCLRSSALAGCEMSVVLRGMLSFIGFGRVRDVSGTARDACVHRLWQGARCQWYCAGCLRSLALAGCEMSAVLRGMLASSAFVGCVSLSAGRGMLEFIGFGRVRDVSATTWDACVHRLLWGVRGQQPDEGCLCSSALVGCEMSAVLRGMLAFISFGRVRDVSGTSRDACVRLLLQGARGQRYFAGCLRSLALAGCEMSAVLHGILEFISFCRV
jgi:hypothetical protein